MSEERQLERETELYEEMKDSQINNIRSSIPKGIGPQFCECGEEIPSARRWGGYQFCVPCATAQEELSRNYRR